MPNFRTAARVTYGDTDNMGIAYHGNYLRWFEIGRTELLRSLGLTYKSVEESGVFLPVSEVHCKYLTPAQYDDFLNIDVKIDKTVKGAIKFDYCITSEDGETVHAKGYTKHAFVDKGGRVIRPPKVLLETIGRGGSVLS
jgi:acyl-CoA thioester hydrolase